MAAAVARAVARAGAGRGGSAAARQWASAAAAASAALPRHLGRGAARSWAAGRLPPAAPLGGGRPAGFGRLLVAGAEAPGGDGGLSEVLQTELQACREDYQQSPMLGEGPEGFQVTEASGDAKVTLRRALGGEEITVVFDCIQEGEEFLEEDPEEGFPFLDDGEEGRGGPGSAGAAGGDAEGEEGFEEEDDGDFEGMEFVDFNVHVRKGDRELVFECIADIGGYTVNQVRMEGEAFAAAAAGAGVPYPGPEFETLDEELQEAFVEFLEGRGVDSRLGAWIIVKASDKEDREYATWLENVASFVRKD